MPIEASALSDLDHGALLGASALRYLLRARDGVYGAAFRQRVAWAPSVAILISTLFCGTLWIPLRQLNEAGLGGPWATAAGFTIPLVRYSAGSAITAKTSFIGRAARR